MSKVPQRDEIWKHKKDGYLARITAIVGDAVFYFSNENGCNNVREMEVVSWHTYFQENFVFIGNGKPLNILFEMAD